MKAKVLALAGVLLIVGVFLVTAVMAAEGDKGNGRDLAAIRQATAHYHRLNVALADGYEILFDCTVNPANPTEAMGQHYINFGLKDDVLELDKPEVLMYEPQRDGSMKLVGVEYVIFEEDWAQSGPPQFLGHELHYKTAVGIHPAGPFYALHAWVWKHNPKGVFADWNPNVSCQYQ